jgi:hypothetical protein
MSIPALMHRQNPDGGWPYVRGGSWTEPTVYAVMALLAGGETDSARRGLQWIRAARRTDNGWPPRPGVDQSTWVTGLVALLPREHLGEELHDQAISWLLGMQGKETSPIYRLREWLLGNSRPAEQEFAGWPWVPDTAAWVGPTSIAILALDKEVRRRPSSALSRRVDEGRRFLLTRMCETGGWNHGSSNALGYAALPYPETTGMALAALRGIRSPRVELALQVGRRFLDECRSADALNWLRMGLRAHGQLPAGFSPPDGLAYRTVPETSLDALVTAAERAGRDPFLNLV